MRRSGSFLGHAALLLLLSGVVSGPSPTFADETSLPSKQGSVRILAEAQELFHEASGSEDAAVADDLYQAALDRLLLVARETGARNGKLFYNIANTYYRLGDIGQAMLYYRRAQLLIPADRNLQHNIEFVRSVRADQVGGSAADRLGRQIFFWHYLFSPKTRTAALIIVYALAGGAMALWIAFRSRRHALTAVSAVVIMLFLGSSLFTDWRRLHNTKAGVVTAEEIVARKGDGIAYEPSFVDPLHAGTEVTVRERRAGWLFIALPDGRTTWVPEQAVTLLLPLTGDLGTVPVSEVPELTP